MPRENENLYKERLDLAYGNPGFLQEFWDGVYPSIPYSQKLMPYKLGKNILPGLEKQILKLHKKHKNVKITSKSHVVITNGAVQALSAALYYYKHKKGTDHVYVPTPYWGRFNDLIAQANMRMVNMFNFDESYTIEQQAKEVRKDHRKGKESDPDWYDYISLITSPNNPDGADTSKALADIRDACYNWSHYTKNVAQFSDEIVIFSLSKLSGHSSTRIGWAITSNEEAATAMREFVELFTSGVSVESQTHAESILQHLNFEVNEQFFDEAGKMLKQRNQRIQKIVRDNKLPVEILSKNGMFLYISCRPQFVFDLKIKCFEGGYFGDAELDEERNHRYRLNIGVNTTDFEEFANRLEYLGKLYKD